MIRKTAKIMAYNGLVSAINAGIVKLQINPEKYNMPGAPVYMPWLWIAPIVAFTMAGVVCLFMFGLLVGLVWTIAVLTVGAFWYQKSYTPFARGKVYETIVHRAKSGIDT
ncbi:MAG: hypothetical protein FWF01_03270, partial [Alphaproteobacteria bacterium]|nr:hypothetical protein [Alphaproteobacteria bacterium]